MTSNTRFEKRHLKKLDHNTNWGKRNGKLLICRFLIIEKLSDRHTFGGNLDTQLFAGFWWLKFEISKTGKYVVAAEYICVCLTNFNTTSQAGESYKPQSGT